MEITHSFASDNHAGVHDDVLTALAAANVGHAPAYGSDEWTARLHDVIRREFGEQAEVFPVFNGTGANVIALQAMLPRWGAVICPQGAHIHTDEAGAPEKVGGLKLLTVPTVNGKLTPELVDTEAWGFGDTHRAQPLAVSVSQTTEVGTCYTVDEIRALSDHAHSLGMSLHMDGARLANAAAHLGVSLGDLTMNAGVDVLSLGGTKNGLLGAEAIVVLDPDRVAGVETLRKMNLHLGSKMRFLSAQLLAMYDGDLWLRSATHANAMAARLADGLAVRGINIAYPTESNAVFARLTAEAAARARQRFGFYAWPSEPDTYRLMCSFDTTEEHVDELIELLVQE